MARKYARSVGDNVRRVMKKRKAGTLKAGSSKKTVTSRKQAIAIALSESRRAGKKVPKQPARKTAKTTVKTKTAKKAVGKPVKKAAKKTTTTRKTTTRTAAKKRTSAAKR